MKSLLRNKNTENCTFLIKGTHLETYNSEDPFIKLLFPYFISRENLFMIFNSIDNKKRFYDELLKFLQNKKYIIILTDTNIGDISDYDYVVYYNVIPNNHIFANHASVIIDYAQLVFYTSPNFSVKIFDHNNLNWYKDILNSITSTREIKNLTLVCQKPDIQKVNFVFSQTKELKTSTVTFLNRDIDYISKHSDSPIKKRAYVLGTDMAFLNSEEYEYIETIPHIVEYSDIVIADFDLNIFEESLSRFNAVTLIYTPEDFIHFQGLIDSCSKFNVTVPNYIMKIADKQKCISL